jgi:phospholipase A1
MTLFIKAVTMRFYFSTAIFLVIFGSPVEASPIDQRIQEEKALQESSFSIIPHKPNYLLPISYNDSIQSYHAYQSVMQYDDDIQPLEIKFQVSFKMPLLTGMIDSPFSLFFGYTQTSFWQAYNSDHSSPFRETNYEPELFAIWQLNKKLPGDWRFKLTTLNLTHQSNGQTEPLSRSWNRIESSFVFARDNLTIAMTPWYRLQESANEDDNPDLLDYYGHGEINAVYAINNNTLSLTSRNNLESGLSKGSLEFNWSFPIHGRIRGYLQLFSGYGNSLIGYNEYSNAAGLGVSLTDWL